MQGKAVYESDIVDLRIREIVPVSFFNRRTSAIVYGIFLHRENTCIGECDLRFGMSEELYYAGNIGYRIYERFRGHHYAYHACKRLLQIARNEHHFQSVLITCSPDNIASKKTIESLAAVFLKTVTVPRYHWLYRRGETIKCIYRISLCE